MTPALTDLIRRLRALADAQFDMDVVAEAADALEATITDGFGQFWPARCPDCGAEMQIVRPGRATCSAECWIEKEE